MKMEQHLNENSLDVTSQQSSMHPTLSHEPNSLTNFTRIKPDLDLDDMEYNVNKTSQAVSNQQIPLPSPLKCEVKEEIMFCQFCPYSDVDFGRLKTHTFTQHPSENAVVSFGVSDHGIKFFCVKETCNFSTTLSNVYEEHLMNCCALHQTLSGKEKERLKSTLQFVLDFHNKHCLSDVTGLLEHFSASSRTSEDDHVSLKKHMEHKDLFPIVSRSSSLSEVQSPMVCEDVRQRKLEVPFLSVPNPVPVFIVQNQNTNSNVNENHTNISENILTPVRNQNKTNEYFLMTGTDLSEMKICKSDDQTNMKTQSEKMLFICLACYKCFQYRSEILTHMRTSPVKSPFTCHICDKEFTCSSHLTIHIRTHTGEKPFKCNVCQKHFIHSSYLKRHTRTHTREKPYKCKVCGKGFAESSNLCAHTRTHTGEKPYKCNVCGRGFTVSSSLKIHKKILHAGEESF